MPYLSNAQRKLPAPAGEDHPRDGEIVPGPDQAPFIYPFHRVLVDNPAAALDGV
jgi:hypothetical protein